MSGLKLTRTLVLFATGAALLIFVSIYAFGIYQSYWGMKRPNGTPAAIEPIDPATVTEINTNGADAIRSSGSEWFIRANDSDVKWPGSIPAIRSALRAAADISALPPAAQSDLPPDTQRIAFRLETGEVRSMQVSPSSIGGKQSVGIDEQLVRAPTQLLAPLTAGPLAWRERAVFPNTGTNVTRLLIQQPATDSSPALEVDLTKTAGRWLIASPVLARADQNAVENAIGRIAGTAIERFIDDPPDLLETNLDNPIFIITVETGDKTRRVRFGANADAAGTHRFATTGEPGVLFVADTELLKELRLDPAAYTDRRITATPAANIHSITVNNERATRTLSGWTEATFNPQQIIQTLTADADSIVTFEQPTTYTPIATITLEDLSQNPLDIIEIAQTESNTLLAKTQLPGGPPVYYTLPNSFRQHLNKN